MHPVKESIQKAYNNIALKGWGYRRKTWPEINIFLSKIKANKILDLGIGNCGQYTTKQDVYGLDFSLEYLKTASHSVKKICGDVEFLPIKSNSFEAVLYISTLHHLPTKKSRVNSLKELKRVLRPGGRALVSVWARYQQRFLKDFLLGRSEIIYSAFGEKRYYHLFSKKELKCLAKEAGFKHIKVYSSITDFSKGSRIKNKNYFLEVSI